MPSTPANEKSVVRHHLRVGASCCFFPNRVEVVHAWGRLNVSLSTKSIASRSKFRDIDDAPVVRTFPRPFAPHRRLRRTRPLLESLVTSSSMVRAVSNDCGFPRTPRASTPSKPSAWRRTFSPATSRASALAVVAMSRPRSG